MSTQSHARIDELEPGLPSRSESRVHRLPHRGQHRRVAEQGRGRAHGDADVVVLRRSAAAAATSPDTFRGIALGVVLSVPIWAGLAWIALG